MVGEIETEAKIELARRIDQYLAGLISDDEISTFAWKITETLPKPPEQADALYCSTVFAVIHLASEDHWRDGVSLRELGPLANQLREEAKQTHAVLS
jgi:hypothetical protein